MNLLPEENKILFKKYYLKRFFAVFGVLIFSIIAVGSIVLMPMYSLILSHKSDLKAELAAYLKKDAELADSVAALEIKKLNNRLNFAENYGKDKKLSGIFKNILVQKNSGIKITFFSYEKGAKQDDKDKVFLSGKAKKRDDLITFESRLKKELRVSEVISPVSNLIKEKDSDFSLTLYIQNEK